MHGAGNDFVMIDAISQKISLNGETIRCLADRHYGIGADQVLLVEKSRLENVDFRYRIFNCDGQEVEQCGNGARCFARFVFENGLTSKKRMRVETQKSIIEPEILDDGRVKVMMGTVSLCPSDLPFEPRDLKYSLRVRLPQWSYGGIEFSALSIGNPWTIIFVDDVNVIDVEKLGTQICFSPYFPKQTNVAFMENQVPDAARMRFFERGVGETLACGTGACCGVVASILAQRANSVVDVQARGGMLQVQWSGALTDSVYLIGDAIRVFDGEIDL